LSGEEENQSEPASGNHQAADLGRPERPKLRRRPLGYKRADVDEAFQARDSELEELKQDIAALWLAFAQHDRMIRSLGGETPPPLTARPKPAESAKPAAAPPPIEAEAESIGNQLSELDEVLAAIEMATQTLEKTYSDEIVASKASAEGRETEAGDAGDAGDAEDSAGAAGAEGADPQPPKKD
jgi:hypothetical protein